MTTAAPPALDVAAIRADFPVLHREVHGRPLVSLDSAATSQKPQAMIDRLAQLYTHEYARVEEGHELSTEATRAFEGTRDKVASVSNAAEPLLKALGAEEAVRASFMFYNTHAEADLLGDAVARLRRRLVSARPDAPDALPAGVPAGRARHAECAARGVRAAR